MSTPGSPADLYRQTVLEHSRHPRNCHRPALHDLAAEGHNALCGDKVSVYVRLRDDALVDVAFEASGCAIATASASMMTEAVTGLSAPSALSTIDAFVGALSGAKPGDLHGDLAALGGVREYPSRVRCATLPWQTLRAALDKVPQTVTTE